VLAIVGRQIRPPAHEPDAQRSLGNDHLPNLPSHSSVALRSAAGVPMSMK
jgi:hypothetical protein